MLVNFNEKNLKAEEAIKEAGLDWKVTLDPLFYSRPGGEILNTFDKVNNKFLVRREDNNQQLGVVGKVYKTVQNVDAFRFMDSLVDDGSMTYENGGFIKGGEKIFLLGNIGQTEIVPGDVVNKYLVLFNTHNGSGLLRVLFTTKRVFCANQAPAILRDQKNEGLSIRHTTNIDDYLADQKAKEVLGIATHQFDEYESFLKRLAGRQMDVTQVDTFLKGLLPMPPESQIRARTIRNTKAEKIQNLFESGQGNDFQNVRGTAWAMYNAVTEFLNYEAPVRGKTEEIREEKRFEKNVLSTPVLLQRANNLLLAA